MSLNERPLSDRPASGHDGDTLALFADLYEFTMVQAYFAEGMTETAVFDLFIRHLPPNRNYLLACGIDAALDFLETLAFSEQAIAHLASMDRFSPALLDELRRFRFSGNVDAVPEGTVVYAGEPIMQVSAPMPQAQIVETVLLNLVHFETMIASKGARVVRAAAGCPVIDFGSRRAHGIDAGLRAARALAVAGFAGTSNVRAAQIHGIPPVGTMAHSYIEAHADELDAFERFVAEFPDTVLLVDSYDTLDGVRNVIRLAQRLGDDFRVSAIRLDSGDLDQLARRARELLDAAGLHSVRIIGGGGLDEFSVADLVAAATPIDSYAVGTRIVTSSDAPSLDAVYKLSAYAGEGRLKLSPDKSTLPGRKQIYRRLADGVAVDDRIALHDEPCDGVPLLVPVMRDGRRLPEARRSLDEVRDHAAASLAQLPAHLHDLHGSARPYSVVVSDGLRAEQARLAVKLGYAPPSPSQQSKQPAQRTSPQPPQEKTS